MFILTTSQMIMCDSEGALNAEPTENHQSAAAPLRSVLRFSVFQLIVLVQCYRSHHR